MKYLLVFLLLPIWTSVCGQSLEQGIQKNDLDIDSCIAKVNYYLNKNLDSALYFAYQANDQLTDENPEEAIKVYLCMGETFNAKGEMDQALEYYMRAKKLNDSGLEEDPEKLIYHIQNLDILTGTGTLKFTLHQYDQSRNDYEAALAVLESLQNRIPAAELARKKVAVYNNIATIYIQIGDYDTALTYFHNALKINQIVKNEQFESSLSNNIGICYLEKKNYDLADHYFLKSLSIRTNTNDKRGQTQCLNNLAKNQVYQGNFVKAQELFEKALVMGKESGHAQSMLVSLESLSNVYDTLGFYKKAFYTAQELKSLSDSIFNQTSAANIAELEADYKREKEKKVAQLELERNRAESQRKQTRNIAIFGALFFLLLTAILLLILMRSRVVRSKLEQDKLNLENQNNELERRTLVEELEFKERELTANALFLLKNNELLANITEKLLAAKSAFRHENQKIIQDIIFELRANQNQNIWDEFEAHFIRVHADFYQKLQAEFPNLTSNEMKLCAFLRLNMSTKEISAITYQSVNSITVARSRLRKKLNIDGEDTQLVNFLMNI